MENTVKDVMLYLNDNGEPLAEVRMDYDTLWLTQKQMASLFEKDVRTINEHIRNILRTDELEPNSVIRNFRITGSDGKSYVNKAYNLDMIISVGYRVNSIKGTRFRQWATNVLREHLTKGYTLDRKRLEANTLELDAAMRLIRKTAKHLDAQATATHGLLDIATRYAQTFVLLQRFDEGLLSQPNAAPGGILAPVAEIRAALQALKHQLIRRGEATELFARENGDGLSALIGNLELTVFGEDAYPSIESKAAHLLYFMIKNHPFVDGNKRCAAYLFVDFLDRNDRLLDTEGFPVINDIGLAALALLVAESDPEQKPVMISLVMNMLSVSVDAGPTALQMAG